MGNWWQIYDPALYPSVLCSLLHFVKKKVRQQEVAWEVNKGWEETIVYTQHKCHVAHIASCVFGFQLKNYKFMFKFKEIKYYLKKSIFKSKCAFIIENQTCPQTLPRWFVANCISIPSSESLKGQNMTPALFLTWDKPMF